MSEPITEKEKDVALRTFIRATLAMLAMAGVSIAALAIFVAGLMTTASLLRTWWRYLTG